MFTEHAFGKLYLEELDFKNIFLVCPIWLVVFYLFFYNAPELSAGIHPGIALTHFHLVHWLRKI
jgi:hypothetical protein